MAKRGLDRRSSVNLSQVPIYGANHAPVVIAFPAAATSAAVAASAPPLLDAGSQSGSEAEARRRERDNFYAEVDAENSSMRGNLPFMLGFLEFVKGEKYD